MSHEMRAKIADQDVGAIRAVVAEWQAAANAGDAAHVTALYTTDGILMPPHAAQVSGSNAIQPFLQQGFFDPFKFEVSLTTDEIEVLGDSAFRRGTYVLKLTPKAGGDPINDNGKYIEIWQRQTDGSWKIARDIWNSDRPLPEN